MNAAHLNVVLVGLPGAGLTTQAALLSKALQLDLVTAGRGNDRAAGMIEQLQRDGVVLDGFPRSTREAEALADIVRQRRLRTPDAVILDVPAADRVARGRAAGCAAPDQERDVSPCQFEELAAYYASRRMLHRVDGTGPPAIVHERIRQALGVTDAVHPRPQPPRKHLSAMESLATAYGYDPSR